MSTPTAEQRLSLTVYFDDDCGFCRRVAAWLDRQPQLVPIHCVGARSDTARQCTLDPHSLLEEVTVVASDGAVYRGTKAFIVCLWALASYRGWSLRLSTEAAMPWARRLFGLVARGGRVTKSGNQR